MDSVSEPKSPREVWLSAALAVARDEMPEPIEISIYDEWNGMHIRVASRAQFDRWAEYLDLRHDSPINSKSGGWILGGHVVRDDGWTWSISAHEPNAMPEPSEQAAELAAILAGES
jgi:hypothetical protein